MHAHMYKLISYLITACNWDSSRLRSTKHLTLRSSWSRIPSPFLALSRNTHLCSGGSCGRSHQCTLERVGDSLVGLSPDWLSSLLAGRGWRGQQEESCCLPFDMCSCSVSYRPLWFVYIGANGLGFVVYQLIIMLYHTFVVEEFFWRRDLKQPDEWNFCERRKYNKFF